MPGGLDRDLEPRLARGGAGDRADRDDAGAGRELAAERLAQVAHGRGGGEGDVVGAARGLDRLGLGLLADGLIEGDGVDLGAALAQRVGKHVAGGGGADDEDAASLDRGLRQRLDQRLGDRALGHDVGGDAVRGELLAVPGPIAATVAPASALASSPAAPSASNSSRAPLAQVTQTSEYSPIASTAARTSAVVDARLDPDRRQLDRLGAERAQRARRGRSPARGRG